MNPVSVALSVLLYVCLMSMTSGLALVNRPKVRPKAQEQFISFLNKDGQLCAKESVTVTDNEARIDVNGKMAYVFDYKQNVLVFKELSKGTPCYYTKFDTSIIPSAEELKKMLAEKQFPMPEETHTMNLQVSKIQPFMRPSVLPLSETLCRDSQIVLLEPKIETAEPVSAVAERHVLRPKREVGWGEVILIVIVIIILL